jgi:hypothetical protein
VKNLRAGQVQLLSKKISFANRLPSSIIKLMRYPLSCFLF